MAFWILGAATAFSNLYTQMGAREMIEGFIGSLDVSPWTILIIMQLSLFILGSIVEDPAENLVGFPTQQPFVIWAGLTLKIEE